VNIIALTESLNMPGIPATLFAEGEVEPSVVCLLCRGVLLDAKQVWYFDFSDIRE
jgi:hypothetical protein